MYADENVIKIKHDVLYEVAKLAFAGELDEKRQYRNEPDPRSDTAVSLLYL